jgi:hypothetical protein
MALTPPVEGHSQHNVANFISPDPSGQSPHPGGDGKKRLHGSALARGSRIGTSLVIAGPERAFVALSPGGAERTPATTAHAYRP